MKRNANRAEIEARYKVSDENMRRGPAMIAEMEADGKKVLRRDDMYCAAVLVTPEIKHIETTGLHGYYPDAVAELYEKWKLEQETR